MREKNGRRNSGLFVAHSEGSKQEQKLIAEKKKQQLVEAKRVLELDRNLIVIAVLITALIAAHPAASTADTTMKYLDDMSPPLPLS